MNNRTNTGTLTAVSQGVQIDVSDQDEVSFQVTGTFVGTVVPEISIDGVNFVAAAVVPYDSTTPGTPVASATAPGAWYARNVTTARLFRVRCSAFTSGSIVVTVIAGRLGKA